MSISLRTWNLMYHMLKLNIESGFNCQSKDTLLPNSSSSSSLSSYMEIRSMHEFFFFFFFSRKLELLLITSSKVNITVRRQTTSPKATNASP